MSHQERDRNVSKILHVVDQRFPQTPIFVFGYSQLARGISYRSRERVPSHLVLSLGKDMAICKLVQAAGRAAGESQRQLIANGFDHVTILTNPEDYDTLCAYPPFLVELKKKMQAEDGSLGETMVKRFPGKYGGILGGRPVAPKRHHAQRVAEETFDFAPALPGECIGREWLESDLSAPKSRMGMSRALLEAAVVFMATDEDSAVSVRAFAEEVGAGGYKEYCLDPADTPSGFTEEQLDGRLVHATLKRLAEVKTTRGKLFCETEAVDLGGKTQRSVKHFYLTQAGLEWIASKRPSGAPQPAGTSAAHAALPL